MTAGLKQVLSAGCSRRPSEVLHKKLSEIPKVTSKSLRVLGAYMLRSVKDAFPSHRHQ